MLSRLGYDADFVKAPAYLDNDTTKAGLIRVTSHLNISVAAFIFMKVESDSRLLSIAAVLLRHSVWW
jgi:hypothetical protein